MQRTWLQCAMLQKKNLKLDCYTLLATLLRLFSQRYPFQAQYENWLEKQKAALVISSCWNSTNAPPKRSANISMPILASGRVEQDRQGRYDVACSVNENPGALSNQGLPRPTMDCHKLQQFQQ